MAKKLTTEEFIVKAKLVHGNKYDYSKVDYVSSRDKVVLSCFEHGEFLQKANSHLQGNGCPNCGIKKNITTEIFKHRANEIHNNKYDYSKVVYENSHKRVKIICKEHGIFEQKPNTHLSGSGCSKCAKMYSYTTKEFIVKANEVHNNKYNYSKAKYKKTEGKIKIICKEHGEFEQSANMHLRGRGCPKCGTEKVKNNRTYSLQQFVQKAKKVHGDTYDYSKVNYISSKQKIKIICPEHGEFEQIPNSHLMGCSCIKCSSTGPSKGEDEVLSFLNTKIESISSDREILSGKELDIYVPSKKLAIEFNGIYWHSDKFRDKNYHLNKTLECEKKGIQLIHIFEDEWDNKKEIVKSRLKNILGLTENNIYARKTKVRIVKTKEKTKFLEENHIQGSVGSKVNLGLYYENELISIMAFGKLRKNLGQRHKEGSWELLRFCNKLNNSVPGGFSKLLKYFKNNYECKQIISYADIRWSQGNVYEKNGFKEVHRSIPNYFYVKTPYICREPRFKYRKSELVKQGFDKVKTEKQIMEEQGFLKIFDCGTIKFNQLI